MKKWRYRLLYDKPAMKKWRYRLLYGIINVQP